jgi:Mrp family chromosome partitioning ATPase
VGPFSRELAQQSKEQLEKVGVPILGVVLNRVDAGRIMVIIATMRVVAANGLL